MHLGLYWLIEENGDLAIATFLSHDLVYSNGVHSVGNPYPISPCVPAYFESNDYFDWNRRWLFQVAVHVIQINCLEYTWWAFRSLSWPICQIILVFHTTDPVLFNRSYGFFKHPVLIEFLGQEQWCAARGSLCLLWSSSTISTGVEYDGAREMILTKFTSWTILRRNNYRGYLLRDQHGDVIVRDAGYETSEVKISLLAAGAREWA